MGKNTIKTFDNYQKNKHTKLHSNTPSEPCSNYIPANDPHYNKLISHLQKAPSNYISFLEFINSYLFRPNMFAALQNKHISLQNTPIIFSGPQDFFGYLASLSNVLEYYINFNDPYFQKLYDLYHSFLNSYAKIPQPYNRYIANVFKSVAFNSELYYIFMHPDMFFHIINKEIVYVNSNYNTYGLGIDILDMFTQQGYCTSTKKLVPLLKTLPRIMDDAFFHTSAPCCSSNYSFNFIAKENTFHAYFSNEVINYEKSKNDYMRTNNLIDLDKISEINISQKCIDTLYNITGGIKQNLDNFSMICALIMTNYYKNINYTLPSKNCSPLSLFIVFAPQDQAIFIRYWLENILLPDFIPSDNQLKEITKPKNILNLIVENIVRPIYIPVKSSKSKETETQIETIKRLIQRKEINVKDNYGLNHTLINHLPVICFVDDPKHLSWLQANFKTKTFIFESSPTLSFEGYKLKEFGLLACILSIHGLKLLYDSNFKKGTNIKWNNQTENFTENFLMDCLKLDESHIYYADDLYNFYTNYYKLFYGDSPLTKICFTKELRKLLSAKSWPYQYKKPRHSRSDNRYAFIGINVDGDKAAKALERAENIRKDNDQLSFANYLIDMQNTVNEILQKLHHDLY